MTDLVFKLKQEDLEAIVDHLLPDGMIQEEAGFAFADYLDEGAELRSARFQLVEWMPVPPEGFHSRSKYHLELTDEMRVRAITKAHTLNCGLVELHSHCGNWPARFSRSDLMGFEEFVPHVRWRLDKRPYVAIVFARETFDAFAWIDDTQMPQRLGLLIADSNARLEPTGLSALRLEDEYD